MRNTLYYGDNLPILRQHIASESVDLVYLDPPFNSNRSYNVLFKEESGRDSDAQITAFEDAWHWNTHAEEAYQWLVTLGDARVAGLIGSLREAIGTNQMMASPWNPPARTCWPKPPAPASTTPPAGTGTTPACRS